MFEHITRAAAEIAVRAVFFRSMWREALPGDRWVWRFILAMVLAIIIIPVALWRG